MKFLWEYEVIDMLKIIIYLIIIGKIHSEYFHYL
jgi:hypothetical protein